MEDCFKLLHFHLGSQITNIRQIKAAVMEAARIYVELSAPGRGSEISRRRRRPGRRLRRLADQFRIERQLHAAGIRQRRGLSHPERLRRSRRDASDDHLRKRPGGRRLSQRAGVQRAGRERLRRRGTAARACPKMPSSRSSICWKHTAPLSYEESARKLSRRAAGARLGAESVQPRLSAARAAQPGRESVIGPSAARSSSWPSELEYLPEELEGLDGCCPTPTSATSRCSRACPTVGPSSSSSPSCRSTG